jgi:hypothetical protein
MEKGDIPARNFFHYKKINEFIDFTHAYPEVNFGKFQFYKI